MGRIKIVGASAGSGKTYNLTYEYVRTVVGNPELYRNTLAVTFTNKATDEMKSRILSQLNMLAEGRNDDFATMLETDTGLDRKQIEANAAAARNRILHDYDNFSVMTIDKFFQRILRAFVKELGIDIDFNLELETDSLLSRSADRLIESLTDNDALRDWLMAYMGENIEAGTSWEVKRQLVKLGEELFKEEYERVAITPDDKRALQKIVRNAFVEADDACKAYTAKAGEFTALMAENDLAVEDFRYGNTGVAGFVSRAAAGSLTRGGTRVFDALEQGAWCNAKAPKIALIDALAPQMSAILSQMLPLRDKAAKLSATSQILSKQYRAFALMSDLKQALTEICREENIVPISEIGAIIARLVADNDAPFIYEKSGNRYSHFMIDEFQDTSLRQWNNFVPLLQNALAQSSGEPVMIVGDVKQSIYRWRSGDWRLLSSGASQQFPENRNVTLNENHRSLGKIVEFNNALMEYSLDNVRSKIEALLQSGVENDSIGSERAASLGRMVDAAYSEYRQVSSDKSGRGYVTYTEYVPEECPLHPIVECVEDLQRRGYRPSDIAVLVRHKSEATRTAEILLAYKKLHPDSPYTFDVITQEALKISSSEAVRFIVAALALAINPADSISRAVYNRFKQRDFDAQLPDDEAEALAATAFLPTEEAFEETVICNRLDSLTDEIPYLQALHQQILDFGKNRIADIGLFLKYWDENGPKKYIPMPAGGNAITVMTIHKAKGLGFKAVVLPYCSWRITPLNSTVLWASPDAMGDKIIDPFPVKYEAKLADSIFADKYYEETVMSYIDSLNEVYVAITRAREELHIMMPMSADGKGPKASKGESNGPIIRNAVGLIEGTLNNNVKYFGSPMQNSATEPPAAVEQSSFGTFRPNEKVAVRFTHERYNEEGAKVISPRENGILMHRALENAVDKSDVERAVRQLAADAVVGVDEAETLKRNIAAAFENPTIAEWFGSGWDEVRNENEIISLGRTFRPDRVMIKEGRAIVVDYKFGLPSPKHHAQVEHYKALLTDMGYAEVEGYVWYIAAERVDMV